MPEIKKIDMKTKSDLFDPTCLYEEITVRKDEASFVYFIFDANDGLCFYSTLDDNKHLPTRTLGVWHHPSLSKEYDLMMDHLRLSVSISSEKGN